MIETFQIPLREIQEKFTKSELVVMGWRSQEQAYKMRLRMKREPRQDIEDDMPKFSGDTSEKKTAPREYADADVPDGLPERFYDEEGGVNLSKTTLVDAVKYMNAIGIQMPIPTPGKNLYGGKLKAEKEMLPTMEELF